MVLGVGVEPTMSETVPYQDTATAVMRSKENSMVPPVGNAPTTPRYQHGVILFN